MSTTISQSSVNTGSLIAGQVVVSQLTKPVTSQGVNYVMLSTDDLVLLTATGLTATLPDPTTVTGQRFTVKLTAIGTGTVKRFGAESIDGVASDYALSAQNKFVTVESDGANWQIVSQN